jgi:hypothetical protein
MQLKDIKVGMKVKIPNVESRTFYPEGRYGTLERNKQIIRVNYLNQDYLYVVHIYAFMERQDCVVLGLKPLLNGMGTYFPSDIEEYVEPKPKREIESPDGLYDIKIFKGTPESYSIQKRMYEEIMKQAKSYPQPDSVKQQVIKINIRDLKTLNQSLNDLNDSKFKTFYEKDDEIYVSKYALKKIKEILEKYGI